jgi:hypothetical protein
MPKGTPNRAVRIPDELWHAALAVATERGETLSDIIRDRLAGYVKEEAS